MERVPNPRFSLEEDASSTNFGELHLSYPSLEFYPEDRHIKDLGSLVLMDSGT